MLDRCSQLVALDGFRISATFENTNDRGAEFSGKTRLHAESSNEMVLVTRRPGDPRAPFRGRDRAIYKHS